MWPNVLKFEKNRNKKETSEAYKSKFWYPFVLKKNKFLAISFLKLMDAIEHTFFMSMPMYTEYKYYFMYLWDNFSIS